MKKILVLSTILLSNMKADLEIQDAIENIKDLRKVLSARSVCDAFNFFKLTQLIKKHEEAKKEFIKDMNKYPNSAEARTHRVLNNITSRINDQMFKAAAMGQFLFVE